MKNNIIEFKSLSDQKSKTAFCFVDTTGRAASAWVQEIVKNQSEYTISNVVGKFYDLYQGIDEDALLNHAADLNYEYAVVFTTGTEFINGYSFFEQIEELIGTGTALAGHILDRGDAYYELHQQCYLINLKTYTHLGRPVVGNQELGQLHQQYDPIRSKENYHDNYTPLWVQSGQSTKTFNHQCHGWNILSTFLNNDQPVAVFNHQTRSSKIHLYPEFVNDFNKNVNWIYKRQQVCSTEFIHTSNTEWDFNPNLKFKQIVTPASGIWYGAMIDSNEHATVIFYDYNSKALDYWRSNVPPAPNIEYKFVLLDLLVDEFDIRSLIDTTISDSTIINFSNIFFYEGTACLQPMHYRLSREAAILENIKLYAPDAYVSFNMRSAGAFGSKNHLHGELTKAADIEILHPKDLVKPTWRFNQDWL